MEVSLKITLTVPLSFKICASSIICLQRFINLPLAMAEIYIIYEIYKTLRAKTKFEKFQNILNIITKVL